jgi:hypothetical protein
MALESTIRKMEALLKVSGLMTPKMETLLLLKVMEQEHKESIKMVLLKKMKVIAKFFDSEWLVFFYSSFIL